MALSNAEMIELARGLPIPVPWDRDAFIANIAVMRGRPITLVPTDTASLGDSPCGLWLRFEHDDLILHEVGTSDYHIDQIVCHEIGHMVLGHGDKPRVGDHVGLDAGLKMCRAVLPDIDPDAVNAVLGRTDYASDQEHDAEMFASILMIAAAEAAAEQSMMRSVFFRDH